MIIGFCLPVSSQEWQELKGDHFIIYFVGDKAFSKEVLRKAEQYYDNISGDLGYSRRSNFWQWENRSKIYIYEDRESFTTTGGYPHWSEGIAEYSTRTINTFSGSRNFINAVLPHEITHLIFRDFVGLDNPNIPLWLDEAVAQRQEPYKRKVIKNAVKYIYEQGRTIPLTKFMNMNVMEETAERIVAAFYIQAMSIVEFLTEEYGTDRFISFCRGLRDGKGIEEALQFAYPTSMRSVEELEQKWIEWIRDLNVKSMEIVIYEKEMDKGKH